MTYPQTTKTGIIDVRALVTFLGMTFLGLWSSATSPYLFADSPLKLPENTDLLSGCILEKYQEQFPQPTDDEPQLDYMLRVREFGLDDTTDVTDVLADQCQKELFLAACELEHDIPCDVDIHNEELAKYIYDPTSQSMCPQGDCTKPLAAHYAGDMIFRWYEGLKDENEDIDASQNIHYPVVLDQRRQNTLIIIHGWQGWQRGEPRQKHRHFHNAKEDTLSAAALMMEDRGMDLSFAFVSGATDDDDLGMMLQCGAGKYTATARKLAQRKMSFVDYLKTQQKGNETEKSNNGCHPHRAFNVGYLDWSQLASNRTIAESEKAIWVPSSKDYIEDKDLLTLWESILSDTAKDSTVTIVGHSLGASLAIRLYKVIAQAALEQPTTGPLPLSRLILADPYFTNFGIIPFDVNYWPGRRARKALDETAQIMKSLRHKEQSLELATGNHTPRSFVGVDIYATPNDATETFSDANRPLKFDHPETVYVELNVQSIHQDFHYMNSRFPAPFLFALGLLDSKIKQMVSINQRKHVYPLYWVLDSLARSHVPALHYPHPDNKPEKTIHSLSSGSSLTNLLRIKRPAQGLGWYKQKEGFHTLSPQDDTFSYQLHIR
ncbi:MAG: hypothetical protein OXC44_02220 [Proteobacteria bacterium]|nr:hypothetical protein [Pseudomonadota bacterium]